MTDSTRTALLIVDTQPTFCEGGGLPVEGGNAVAARIGDHLAAHRDDYDLVVASQDWHLDPGEHWAPEGTEPNFTTTWPRHGAAGTDEAALHPALLERAGDLIDDVVRKGMDRAAYSAFEGVVVEDDGGSTLVPTGPPLAEHLRAEGIERLDVVGIATDHCVRMSALDAAAAGFHTRVLLDLTAGVAPETTAAAIEELRAAGVEVTTP
jgi:nicotinamidase/pyrazinamidase